MILLIFVQMKPILIRISVIHHLFFDNHFPALSSRQETLKSTSGMMNFYHYIHFCFGSGFDSGKGGRSLIKNGCCRWLLR
jgi:hypothetical protein